MDTGKNFITIQEIGCTLFQDIILEAGRVHSLIGYHHLTYLHSA